jgi:hypothetical protein
LKVLAVLAASGQIPARKEWDALVAALGSAKFPVTLRVFVCEKALYDLKEPRVNSVEWVPDNDLDLVDAIQRFAPHVLHFFCHGSTEQGPHLQIATRKSWPHMTGQGDVTLDPSQLRPLAGAEEPPWLITLNCCEGAAGGRDTRSLARSLVDLGFPVVAGMREAVPSADANVFCQSLYEAVIDELARCLKVAAPTVEIEWCKALCRPRRRLLGHYTGGSAGAEASKPWTLPVLYVRPDTFRLRVGRPDEAKRQAQLDVLRGLLTRAYPPDASLPTEFVKQIKERIAELEAELAAAPPPTKG